jgi:hypothetical protein
MRKILITLIVLLLPVYAWGAAAVATVNGVADASISTINGVSGTSIATAGGAGDYNDGDSATLYCSSSTSDGTNTWLRCEDYEGSGSCDSSTGGSHCWSTWTCTGTQNSSGSPIDGGGASDVRSMDQTATGTCVTSFTATTPAYGFLKINFTEFAGAGNVLVSILDASNNVLMLLATDPGGTKIRLVCGTATGDTGVISTAQTYNVWWDYTAEAGVNDGIAHLYMSTDGTKGAAVGNIHTCTVAGTPAKIKFLATDTETRSSVDRIRVSASDITGVP